MSDSPKPNRSQPVVPPIVLSTTFDFPTTEAMARAASHQTDTLYTRWSNPTLDALEARLAELEGAARAVVTGSGMGAISLALLAGVMEGGGELLVMREVYGGTHELVEDVLRPLGVRVRRAGLDELASAVADLPPGSHVHVETPTNPLVRVVDLPAIRAAAPEGTRISVDVTFATPLNFRPLEHGADLAVHSVTKYLAGHHDVIAGVVAGTDPALMKRVWTLRKLLGPVLDPAAAYRVWRGLETLELRVARQNASALELARRLSEHPAVTAVHHPGLPGHPDHALAKRLMRGAGGVLSFELPSREAAAQVADGLRRFANAPSLGGTRSTVSWPSGVSHVGLSDEERRLSGLPEGLIRLAIGIEPLEDLWRDLANALESAPN